MKEYEINEETLALLVMDDFKTKVIEKNNEYVIDQSTYEIMEHSCNYFGSSLEGRKEGSKAMLGTNYKIPILIEESREIIFFPTSSLQSDKCEWIALKNIRDYNLNDDNTTIITFENGKKVFVKMKYLNFQNQILRATRLESIIRKRKNA